MTKIIKVDWKTFVEKGAKKVANDFLMGTEPVKNVRFITNTGGSEGDRDCYDLPSVVEIEIEEELNP